MEKIIMKGIVTEWNGVYGTIESEDGEKIYAHCAYLNRRELTPSVLKRIFTKDDLVVGELVEYEIGDWDGDKKKIEKYGLRAVNIRPVERIEKLKKEREEKRIQAEAEAEAEAAEEAKLAADEEAKIKAEAEAEAKARAKEAKIKAEEARAKVTGEKKDTDSHVTA